MNKAEQAAFDAAYEKFRENHGMAGLDTNFDYRSGWCDAMEFVRQEIECPDCHGNGCWSQTSPRGIGGQVITTCDRCGGTGQKRLAELEAE